MAYKKPPFKNNLTKTALIKPKNGKYTSNYA
jgi:hypothetical protein